MRTIRTLAANVEARIVSDVASVQIIRLAWQENAELLIDPLEHFQIDLCLSARLQGMSVCYPERWGTQRFERVGELMLIPPGEKVIARCDSPGGAGAYSHASTVLRLAPELVHAWHDGGVAWGPERLETALDIIDESIYSLMGRLTREALAVSLREPTAASRALLELIARQLGIEIARYLEGRTPQEFKGGLAAWRLRLIDQRAQQTAKAPSIAELASLCKISARQLQRGFHVSRGCTIGRYIEHCQIDNAKRLLQQGQPVASVAAALGYASASGFTHAFRRATGSTPAQFRQQV